MHNVSVQRPAQTLSVIGIERIHTHYGSLYRVVSHPSQEFTEYYLYSGVCEPLFGIWDMGNGKEIYNIYMSLFFYLKKTGNIIE